MGRGREKSVILPNVHHGGPRPWLMMFFWLMVVCEMTSVCTVRDGFIIEGGTCYLKVFTLLVFELRHISFKSSPWVISLIFVIWHSKMRWSVLAMTPETSCWSCTSYKFYWCINTCIAFRRFLFCWLCCLIRGTQVVDYQWLLAW